MKEIVERAAKIMQLGGVPEMKVQNRRRGRAHPNQGYFTIPLWATKRHRAFLIAYIIHELAHFDRRMTHLSIGWYFRPHGKALMRIECETAEAFGLRLCHQKVYLREIRDLESNRPLCGQYGYPTCEPDVDPACLI